jgi:hypothetical protein
VTVGGSLQEIPSSCFLHVIFARRFERDGISNAIFCHVLDFVGHSQAIDPCVNCRK